jgi:tetraacyldisaccharide 4'-kinase
LAEGERGATDRAVATIVDARERVVPKLASFGALYALPWLLSRMWIAGGKIKRKLATPGRVNARVISIGGLAMGGAGKTPMVRYIARQLHENGADVAVLTRGYRRRGGDRLAVIPRGGTASTEDTGDEAQTILRDGFAHLGISADRFAAARAIEERFHPNVFLLDDGFQHAGLHKDFELVLLDGLDPFAGGCVFPIGRLREPLSALARADAIVITRAGNRRFDGVHQTIRRFNQMASIFHSRVVPLAWVDASTGERCPKDAFAGVPVVAFCGLANPDSFRRTLAELGCQVRSFQAFPDHHAYLQDDLRRLADRVVETGSAALLTTEKDIVKQQHFSGIQLFWLDITIDIEPAEDRRASDLLSLLGVPSRVR